MRSLQVEVNGTQVTIAGAANAERIAALLAIYPTLDQIWLKVEGEVSVDDQPDADASWFSQPLVQGDSVTLTLVDSDRPDKPDLSRSDLSEVTDDNIPFACSFCGKKQIEVLKMYAGTKAQICWECIQFFHTLEQKDIDSEEGREE